MWKFHLYKTLIVYFSVFYLHKAYTTQWQLYRLFLLGNLGDSTGGGNKKETFIF